MKRMYLSLVIILTLQSSATVEEKHKTSEAQLKEIISSPFYGMLVSCIDPIVGLYNNIADPIHSVRENIENSYDTWKKIKDYDVETNPEISDAKQRFFLAGYTAGSVLMFRMLSHMVHSSRRHRELKLLLTALYTSYTFVCYCGVFANLSQKEDLQSLDVDETWFNQRIIALINGGLVALINPNLRIAKNFLDVATSLGRGLTESFTNAREAIKDLSKNDDPVIAYVKRTSFSLGHSIGSYFSFKIFYSLFLKKNNFRASKRLYQSSLLFCSYIFAGIIGNMMGYLEKSLDEVGLLLPPN